MVGGSDADVARLMPIFDTLRPAGDVADGFVHAGPVGAGHYAKMVHNGIEYGLMMAYAEGYELLAAEPLITDTQAVLQAWTNGTVVRSWLQQLLAKALKEDPGLADISDYTEDSGEGRWTVEEAIHHRVPTPVIAAALFARFASRQEQSPTMKAVSALRNQFGGHAVQRIPLSG
jgi:6-phosphogluconate dehydrogenase